MTSNVTTDDATLKMQIEAAGEAPGISLGLHLLFPWRKRYYRLSVSSLQKDQTAAKTSQVPTLNQVQL